MDHRIFHDLWMTEKGASATLIRTGDIVDSITGTGTGTGDGTGTGVNGVFTVQITTAAAAGDKIKIEGVDYECAADEDVAAKKFAGANAAAQVTSLLKMVVCDDFTVAAVSGATDKIGFTQKVALTGHAPTVVVTQAAEAGAMVIGNVTETTTAVTGTGEGT